MEKLLLLGDEALAQGAIDAGMSGVFAYPGTPSTETTVMSIQILPLIGQRFPLITTHPLFERLLKRPTA